MPTFELSGLPNYSDDAIIAEMKRVAALIPNSSITARDFDQLSKVHSSGIRRRFGGWRKALIKAGLEDRYSGSVVTEKMKLNCGKRHTNEQILSELKRVAAELKNSTFTAKEFTKYSSIHAESVSRRFGSWATALANAGLKPGRGAKRYTELDFFENLLSVWTFYGRQPTYGEMRRPPSTIGAKTYEARWGTWRKALMAFMERANSDLTGNSMEPRIPENSATPLLSSGQLSTPASKRAPIQPRQVSFGLRYAVLKRDSFRCVICGVSPATQIGCQLHVDHVIAFSRGGKTVFENLQTLCSTCNIGKGNRP